MPPNRLDLTLGLDYSPLLRGLNEAERAARTSGSKIGDGIGAGAEGAARVVDSLSEVKGEFSDTAKSGEKAFRGLEGEAKEAGAGIEKSLDQVNVQRLMQALQKLEKEFDQLEAGAKSDLQGVEKALDGVAESARETAEATNLIGLKDGARQLADDIGVIASQFNEAGGAARRVEREIKAAFSNTSDQQKALEAVDKLRKSYGDLIDEGELAKAIKRLDTFGVATEKNFERITAIAVSTGKGIDDVADDFGEFLASVNSGKVDIGVIETLRSNFGIGAKELEAFGAKLDGNNKLLGRNRREIKLAQDALIAYVDQNEKFQNVSERAQDAQSKLAGEVDEFNRSVGEQVNILKNQAAEAVLGFAQSLNELSDRQKAIIGIGSNVVSSVTSVGAKLIETGSFALLAANQAKQLGFTLKTAVVTNAQLAAGATAAMGAGIVVAVGLIGTIIKTAYDWAKAIKQAEEAHKSLIDTQERFLAANQDAAKYITQNIEAIRAETAAIEDAGDRRIAITKAIIAKETEYRKQRDAGNTDRSAELFGEITALKRTRAEYDAQANAVAKYEAKAAEATKARYEESREAFLKFKEELSRGFFDSNAKALKDLESIASGLSGDALKEAQAERKKLQQAILGDELATLKASITAQETTIEQGKSLLGGLLTTYEANSDQRKSIERDFTSFLKGEGDKRLQAQQALKSKELELQKRNLELQKSAQDDSVSKLQEQLSAGEDVVDQLNEEVEARNENLKKIAEEEAALAKLKVAQDASAKIKADPGNAKQIKQQQAEEERQIDVATAQKKAALDAQTQEAIGNNLKARQKLQEDAAKKAADLEAKQAELARQRYEEEIAASQQAFAERKRQLDEEAQAGRDVSQERIKLAADEVSFQRKAIAEKLKLQQEEIKQKQALANVGATPEQERLNAEKANLELQKAQREAQAAQGSILDANKQRLIEQTAELVKQRDLLEEQIKKSKELSGFDSGFGTVSTDINSNAAGIGVGRREVEKQIRALDKQITRNQGILGNAANTPLGVTGGPQGGPVIPPEFTAAQQTNNNLLGLILAAIQQGNSLSQRVETERLRAPSSIGNNFANGSPKAPGIGLR